MTLLKTKVSNETQKKQPKITQQREKAGGDKGSSEKLWTHVRRERQLTYVHTISKLKTKASVRLLSV